MRLLRTDRIDLMQIHNLVDWRTHLADAARLEGATAASAISASPTTPRAPTPSVEAVLRAREARLRADQLLRWTIARPSGACCRSPPSAASR